MHHMEISHSDLKSPSQIFQVPVEIPENTELGGKILSIRLCVAPKWKTIFRYISYVCSCFLTYLLAHWVPSFYIMLSLKESNILDAKKVVIYGADNNVEIVDLTEERTSTRTLVKVFYYRLFKYHFDESTKSFKECRFDIGEYTNNQIHQKFGRGLDEMTLRDHTTFFGKNLTDIPKRSWLTLLIDEILSPLYVFELFCLVVWINDDYAYYSALIFVFSAASIIVGLRETVETNGKLRTMSYFETPITVYRKVEGETKQFTVNSSELVPGDVIEIPQSLIPCDAIILNGSCIMVESMLTGESIPVVKTSLPYNNACYDPKEHKQHTVYAGTQCMQTRYYQENAVLALVISTGFATVKGDLIRTMMYPKPTDFRFYSDAFKFVSILAVIALVGFIIDLPGWLSIGGFDSPLYTILVKTSEIITVTVPPALPTCIQIGISMALVRLKQKSIYCISPTKVNEAGRVNVMCFDKTGTLTEEGLELLGVRPIFFDKNSQQIRFTKMIADISSLTSNIGEEERETELQNYIMTESISNKPSVYKTTRMFPSEQMLEIMAACHSLTIIDAKMVGDPLDLKMFQSTGWIFDENDGEKYDALVSAVVKPPIFHIESLEPHSAESSLCIDNIEIGIIRKFEFSSKLQRMSVVVKNLQEPGFKAHVKGSPEKVRELCRPETIPQNFHHVLEKYTEEGYRVLACATRPLGNNYRKIMAANREDIEKEFTFVGFLIMENKLKAATTEIIDVLHRAEIKTVMVTGDNALTAISVARQCDIIGQNQRVFLGDLGEKKIDGKDVIQWKDFDFSERVLNMDLEPDYLYESKILENSTILDEVQLRENINIANDGPTINNDLEHNGNARDLKDTLLLKNKPSAGEMSPKKCKEEFVSTPHINDLGIPFFNVKEHGDYCIAVTGRAFSLILREAQVNDDPQYQYMLEKLMRRCLVFARMLPDEKASMIKCMMADNNVVGMCGDGANDVAALKTANIGVSLSQAEASIAAPFTSTVQDVSCIPTLLREGRSALSTSYQEFKFIALYSIIQFAGVTMLYSQTMDFTNWQYYHVDVLIVLSLSATMAMSGAHDELTQPKPTGRLISVHILTSVIGQMVLQTLFQIGAYLLLLNQPWYQPGQCQDNFDSGNACSENTTLYIVSIYQYCMVSVVFMVGKPFKRPFYTNIWYTSSFIILIILNLLATYNPFDWQFLYDQDDWAAEVPFLRSWIDDLMGLIIINSILTIVWEKIAVGYFTAKWKKYRDRKKRRVNTLESDYKPPSLSALKTT